MRLDTLLTAVPGAQVRGQHDVDVADIVYDSRRVRPGSLFVALPSARPGHAGGEMFVETAVRAGAVAVVTQDSVSTAEPVATIHVADARAALADLSAVFFDHPSRHLRIFAVTGTDGKTTTAYLLEQMLAAAGHSTGLIGTVEIKVAGEREANLDRMTTPEAPDVQRLLRRMVDAGVTHVAMEASSHALALQRLRGCKLAVTGLTNITADHIEFHGSPEAYFAAKASLFIDLGRDCPAVLNRDDPSFDRLAGLVGPRARSYGIDSPADFRAENVRASLWGSRFTLQTSESRHDALVPLPGAFNVSNALAAVAMAFEGDVPVGVAVESLRHAAPPPGRMQRLESETGVTLIVDYAHTEHAFRTVLGTLRHATPPPHRLIAVFGATGDRDRAKRPVLASVAHQLTDFFFITNEDPYQEDPDAIMGEVAAGLPASEQGRRYAREPDRGRAIQLAVERAQPGDVVVILGKGHEQSMVVNGRKEQWSDIAAARRALAQ